MSPKRLEGWLDNGRGEPLADIPAVATILGTSTVVDTTITDDAGRWTFAGLPTADEYLVTLSDTAGNAVSRAPWSGEMRELWVRDRLDVLGKPLVLDPAAGNSLAWTATGLFVPPVPTVDLTAYYTKTQSDTKFVDVTGDTMSGSLGIVNSTSTRISNVRAAGSLQRPGIDFERWKTTVDTIEEVAVGSTIGTFGFNASGATNLAYGGSIYAYVDAPIVGGTAPIAFSFYHATLGETYRLDSQGRGWFAPPADTSIFPSTPGLYISGKWVGVSPTAGNSLTWNANGFYVNVPAVTDLWVDLTGDTMTGLLTQHGAATTTIVHQAKLPADTQPRFTIKADGRLDWGGGGASAVDTAIYRVTAGDFRITSNFSGSTNNTRDLGFGTVQWKAIYGNQLFLSGDGTSGPAWAASGALRLRNGATGNIAWRNAANTADLALGVDATNALVFNGAALGGGLTQAAADLRYLQLTGGSLSGALTITSGDLTLNAGRINILQANAGLEFGAQGTANTPFFDFHSGATNVDFDVRLIASGGTGLQGQGTLEINATLWKVSANQTVSGTLRIADGALSAPSLGFVNDTDNGLRMYAGDTWRLVAGGVDIAQISAGGLTVVAGNLYAPGLLVNSRPVIMAGCRVTHNALQTITTGTPTVLAFNLERFDSDNFHDNVTNNSRLTVPAGLAGKYLIWVVMDWVASTDITWRQISLRHNGSTLIGRVGMNATNSISFGPSQNLTVVYDMAVGDYVEVLVRHERGSNLDVYQASNTSPEFGMQRMG